MLINLGLSNSKRSSHEGRARADSLTGDLTALNKQSRCKKSSLFVKAGSRYVSSLNLEPTRGIASNLKREDNGAYIKLVRASLQRVGRLDLMLKESLQTTAEDENIGRQSVKPLKSEKDTIDGTNANLGYTPVFIQRGPTCKVFALACVLDFFYSRGKSLAWLPPYKSIKTACLCPDLIIKGLKDEVGLERRLGASKMDMKEAFRQKEFRTLSLDDMLKATCYERDCINELETILQQMVIRKRRSLSGSSVENSLRGIAKKVIESAQGEVMSPELLKDLAASVCLVSEIKEPETVAELIKNVVEELKQKRPVVTFTQGIPESREVSDAQWQEHAIMITGYDSVLDEFTYIDNARQMTISSEKLWHLMSSISVKKEKEFYIKPVKPDCLTENVSLASDIGSKTVNMVNKWNDCEMALDINNYYVRVKKQVFFDVDEIGRKTLDKKGLDELDLEQIKSLRKSREVPEGHSNFRRKIMTFKPVNPC